MQQQSFLSPASLMLCLFWTMTWFRQVCAINPGELRGLQHADSARGDQRRALSLPDVSLGPRHSFWTSPNLTWALSVPSCPGEVLGPRSPHQELPWCPVQKLPFLS